MTIVSYTDSMIEKFYPSNVKYNKINPAPVVSPLQKGLRRIHKAA